MGSAIPKILGIVALAASTLGSGSADAGLMFEVHRVDDSTAEIRGTGEYDFSSPGIGSIALEGATSVGNAGVADAFSGDFTLGGFAPDFAFVRGTTFNFVLHFPVPIPTGAVPAGMLTSVLDVETWKPVGTLGNIIVDGRPASVLGSYAIVSAFTRVPEPATLALLGAGLAGLGFIRHGQRH